MITRNKGGLASYADLNKAGFNKALLKTSLKSNRINRIDKGLYQLSEGISLSNPDLVIISIKAPNILDYCPIYWIKGLMSKNEDVLTDITLNSSQIFTQ